MANIEIEQSSEDSMSIEVLLKITKEIFEDKDDVEDDIQESIPEEIIEDEDISENDIDSGLLEKRIYDPATNNFTDNITNVLITSYVIYRENIDKLLSSMIDNICEVNDTYANETIIVFDTEDNKSLYLADKRIVGIEEAINYLCKIVEDNNSEQQPKYLFINEIEKYFNHDPDKFIEEFTRISQIKNFHIIGISYRPSLLCYSLIKLFDTRCGFFHSESVVSRLLYGSNAALSVFDDEIIASKDYGQTSVINTIQKQNI